MNLGKYIETLQSFDPTIELEMGLGNPHSWRGNYSELAFEPKPNMTVGEMLEEAKGAVGKTFTGWKGGEFKMDEYTSVHVDYVGRWSDGEHLFGWFLQLLIERNL